MIVYQEFDDLHERLNDRRGANKHLTVIHGGVYYSNKSNYGDVYDPEVAFEKDPMTKLKRYAEENKLRLVDLFKYFDKDNSWSVDRDEFLHGVKVKDPRTPLATTVIPADTAVVVQSLYIHYFLLP